MLTESKRIYPLDNGCDVQNLAAKIFSSSSHDLLSSFARADLFRCFKERVLCLLLRRVRNLFLELIHRIVNFILLFEADQVAIRLADIFLVVCHAFTIPPKATCLVQETLRTNLIENGNLVSWASGSIHYRFPSC